MQRRQFVAAAAAPALLQGCGAGAVQTFPSLDAARSALKALLADGATWRASGAWNLPQVLNHAAQSVEYSLKGFPEPKSALFQHTVGSAAFAVFDSRGAMSHGLDEPIPGAPALAATDALEPAVARLLKALQDFEAHTGALAPHFAYGALDKAQYTRAHLMHLANHWTLVTKT
jgi:hypothetical protein